jgi:hypothetical protein
MHRCGLLLVCVRHKLLSSSNTLQVRALPEFGPLRDRCDVLSSVPKQSRGRQTKAALLDTRLDELLLVALLARAYLGEAGGATALALSAASAWFE